MPKVLTIFLSSETASAGGVVYRDRWFVHHHIGRDVLLKEVRARGWYLVETKLHYVVICNPTFTLLA